jgi:hypothetical protein
MALEPCKVCGSLTSTEEEICLVCGYPRRGRKVAVWMKLVAYFLVLIFAVPIILSFFYKFNFEEFERRRKRIDTPETIVINKISNN